MARVPLLFDGGLPFCAYELTDDDFNNWDATDKASWMPFTSETKIFDFFWRLKSVQAQAFNSDAANSEIWFAYQEPGHIGPISFQFEEQSPLLILDTDFDYNSVCGNNPELTIEYTGGASEIWHTVSFRPFNYSFPSVSGEFSGNDLFQLLTYQGTYYVPVSIEWIMIVSTFLFPPENWSSSISRANIFSFSSGAGEVFTDPIFLTVNLFGSSATLRVIPSSSSYDSVGAKDESFQIDISPTFPYHDSDE